jgi:hypothetical protein
MTYAMAEEESRNTILNFKNWAQLSHLLPQDPCTIGGTISFLDYASVPYISD